MAPESPVHFRMGGRVISSSRTRKSPPRQHPATVFNPDTRVIFLDLPRETRDQIYGYLLEEEKPIALRMVVRQGAPREIARYNSSRWSRGAPLDALEYTSLLFVNKQIYSEAIQTLYGNNTFRFQSTTVLKDLLKLLGSRASHLRYIEILNGGYVKSSIRDALSLLCQAQNLKKLQFGHLDFCQGSPHERRTVATPEKFALDCEGLLKSLRASYQANNMRGSVLDVVSISLGPPCHTCKDEARGPHARWFKDQYMFPRLCRCMCSQSERNNKELCAKVRELFAATLGIEEE